MQTLQEILKKDTEDITEARQIVIDNFSSSSKFIIIRLVYGTEKFVYSAISDINTEYKLIDEYIKPNQVKKISQLPVGGVCKLSVSDGLRIADFIILRIG